MRFCAVDGCLDFQKNQIASAHEHLKPWFEWPARWQVDTRHLLFGHWAALAGKCQHDQVTATDTGCVYGNHLTAVRRCLKTASFERITVTCIDEVASHH